MKPKLQYFSKNWSDTWYEWRQMMKKTGCNWYEDRTILKAWRKWYKHILQLNEKNMYHEKKPYRWTQTQSIFWTDWTTTKHTTLVSNMHHTMCRDNRGGGSCWWSDGSLSLRGEYAIFTTAPATQSQWLFANSWELFDWMWVTYREFFLIYFSRVTRITCELYTDI